MPNFHPDTSEGRGGLLFRFDSSVLVRGGRGAADRHRCVWGALTVSHWVCPRSPVCASPSTLLRLLAALYGAGPALRAVPVFGFSTKARTWLRLCFVPSPAGAAQAARSLMGALSPGAVRLLPSAVPASVSAPQSGACILCLAATLPADVDHPEPQEVFG